MNPLEIYDSTRDHLDAQDNFWSGVQIWRRMDSAQREIVRDIIKERPSFFIDSTAITFVANQAEYALPINARRGSRVVVVGNNQVSPTATIVDADIRSIFDGEDATVVNLTQDLRFLLVNNKLRVMPTPSTARASALTVYYNPQFGNMVYGTASAGGNNTLTAFTSAADYSTNYGWLDTRTDYYKGMELRLISGTGAGQYEQITGWDGSNLIFTVENNWTTNPDNTTVFAVISPVPEDNHDAVSMNAALRASIKGRTRYQELHRSYHGYQGQTGLRKELLAWITERESFRARTVTPADYGD